jgi:hypothetical protein
LKTEEMFACSKLGDEIRACCVLLCQDGKEKWREKRNVLVEKSVFVNSKLQKSND